MTANEERDSKRLSINQAFDSFDQFIQEYATNISHSGVFIRTQTPHPIGSRVDLQFSIILEELEMFEGSGTVVRVEKQPAGMGIIFDDLNDRSRQLVDRVLASQRQGDTEVSDRPTTVEGPR